MRIVIIDCEDIYVDDQRGLSLQKAIMSKQPTVLINGNLYRTSSITAVTDEKEPHKVSPHRWGEYVATKCLPEPKGDGKGLERYLKMRKGLKI
jgi:hypothetical protein